MPRFSTQRSDLNHRLPQAFGYLGNLQWQREWRYNLHYAPLLAHVAFQANILPSSPVPAWYSPSNLASWHNVISHGQSVWSSADPVAVWSCSQRRTSRYGLEINQPGRAAHAPRQNCSPSGRQAPEILDWSRAWRCSPQEAAFIHFVRTSSWDQVLFVLWRNCEWREYFWYSLHMHEKIQQTLNRQASLYVY